MSASPIRLLMTIVQDILVMIAVLLAVALVVAFFGGLRDTGAGQGVLRVASCVTVPFGVGSIDSSFGGVFLADAAVTLVLVLLADWLVMSLRERL